MKRWRAGRARLPRVAALLLWTGVALDLATLAGVIVRGHWKRTLLLPPLLVVLAASATLVGLCPDCNTWDWWLAKELLHEALFFALGVELALRLFGSGSRLRWAASAWTLLVLIGLAAPLLLMPARPPLIDVLPRIAAALAWLYGGLALLLLVSRRGLGDTDQAHVALLVGLALYTMFYAVTWLRTGDDTTTAGAASPLVFDLVMVLLLRAVWRRPPGPV